MRSSVASMMRSVWQQGSCRKARRSLGQGQPTSRSHAISDERRAVWKAGPNSRRGMGRCARGRSEGALRERWTGSNR